MANKARRLVSLSIDLDKKLEDTNASALIEELLQNHYNYLETNDMKVLIKKKEDLEIAIDDKKHRLQRINDKILLMQREAKEAEDYKEEKRLLEEQRHQEKILARKEIDRRIAEGEISQQEGEVLMENLKNETFK